MSDYMEKPEKEENYLAMIDKIIQSIQYGTVTVIVQDGKVIQIEKNEKYRVKK